MARTLHHCDCALIQHCMSALCCGDELTDIQATDWAVWFADHVTNAFVHQCLETLKRRGQFE